MGYILHQRNGATFLNKLRPEVAVSKTTVQRLQNYAALSLEFYTEVMRDLLSVGPGTGQESDGLAENPPED
jgi:hypothetical protein